MRADQLLSDRFLVLPALPEDPRDDRAGAIFMPDVSDRHAADLVERLDVVFQASFLCLGRANPSLH